MNNEKAEEKLAEIMASKLTLADYESKSIKTILPQCIGTILSSTLNTFVGFSLAYSGILIPAIESPNSDIKVTKVESSWIASITTLLIAVAGLICGPIMDKIGRLNTVKVSIIPMFIGWILIAVANNVHMLIVGRILIGITGALGANPVPVYITEIARSDLRGALVSVLTLFSSIGMELVYLSSIIMGWRTMAWAAAVLCLIPVLLLFFIHESPTWLVSKGKDAEARRSLKWLHKYHRQQPNDQDIVEIHLSILKKEQNIMQELDQQKQKRGNGLKGFLKPTGYKPIIILLGLFVIQQFSGAYVIIFNAVIFFQEVGTDIDPILASNLITGSTVVMSLFNIFSLKIFKKKHLMLVSCVGMGICLFISGLFTKWIHEGKTGHKWIPLTPLFMYMVLAMTGLMPVPWTMCAEVFPLHLRGTAASLVISIGAIIMFASIQSYRSLNYLLGGSVGIQFFYGIVCFLGVGYIYFFVPETKGKKLSEIEEYFK